MAIGFFIGAVVMAIGGIAEMFFGVKAEQHQLEDIAEPLTAEGEAPKGERAEEPGRAGEHPGESEEELRRKAERIRERAEQRRRRDLAGLRRYRPGPGRIYAGRGMPASAPFEEVGLDREVEIIERALQDRGTASRRELARRVGARYWGPGRFRAALREAVAEGRTKPLARDQYAPVSDPRGERDREPS